MNNYEYIIACMPALQYGGPQSELPDAYTLIENIKEQCGDRDGKLVDFLRSGFDAEHLGEEFYLKALSHKDPFIKAYFAYDLNVRNAKVDFINRELGRPADTDIVLPEKREDEPFDDLGAVNAVLEGKDMLVRERSLDNLMWQKIDEITRLDFFNIDTILGIIAKLQIAGRWTRLDEQTGRELFRQFVQDIRQTYDNKKNSI